jgi:hypothetical protein
VKARDWLKAHKDGTLVHDWAPLRLAANGHVAVLRVSADAVRVLRGGENVRETAGAYAYQQLADVFGALMPTAKILEERHRAASVKIEPMVAPLIKPGGNVGNVQPAEASSAIDKAVRQSTDVCAGDWLVSNVGKQFVLDRACNEKVAVNHGFIVPLSACRNGQWRGTPTAESVALGTSWRVIQRRGTAHGFGETRDQDDYSQTVILVDDVCELNGVEVPTSKLYTELEYAPLVLHDGLPLAWSRHPGVPLAGSGAPISEPPDTLPTGASGPVFIAAEKTPATPQQVFESLARAWKQQLGEEPKRESLLVLLAQWAFETGRGKAMWNFNLGNAKGKPGGGDGRCWTFFACNELLPVAHANALVAKAGLRRDGGPGNDVVITSIKDGIATVWFYPSHPVCCFRAFRTLDEGAKDYFDMLRKRFASAWPAVLTGNPAQFSHLLKLARYYTADESHYTRSLISIYAEMAQKVGLSV